MSLEKEESPHSTRFVIAGGQSALFGLYVKTSKLAKKPECGGHVKTFAFNP